MMRPLALSLLPLEAAGHGSMHIPIPRNNQGPEYPSKDNWWGNGCLGNSCLWWNGGCYIGCEKCSGTHVCETVPSSPSNDGCDTPMEPTLPDWAKTVNFYGDSTLGDWSKYNPWRAPGYAPVESACGVAGAYWDYPDSTMGGQAVDGYPTRTAGESILPTSPSERWYAGDTVEVAWQMRANHGGGYQYRLCPKWVDKAHEDCFQKYVVPFATDTTIIRYLDGSVGDFEIPAVTVDEGTWPEGSAWRRNPVPNCLYGLFKGHPEEAGLPDGTQYTPHANCPEGCSFEPAFDEGCGTNSWVKDQVAFAIVDLVMLPPTPGEYLLSWRWDSEQTAQVWANCADVVLNPAVFNPWAIQLKDIAVKCIDLPGGDTTNGNLVWIWDCDPSSESQQWTFDSDSYQIKYLPDESKCLDIPEGDMTPGNQLHIWDCDSASTGWGYDWDTNGIYSTTDNSMCIDLTDGNNDGGNPVQIWGCDTPNIYGQRWFVPGSSEQMSIGSQCIDLPGSDITGDSKLQLWDCNGHMTQAWTWAKGTTGREIRFGPHKLKCLDVSAGDTTAGNELGIWDCNGSENQQWNFDSDTGAISHVASGMCVDGGNFQNGNAIMLWECNGEDQQNWVKSQWAPAMSLTVV